MNEERNNLAVFFWWVAAHLFRVAEWFDDLGNEFGGIRELPMFPFRKNHYSYPAVKPFCNSQHECGTYCMKEQDHTLPHFCDVCQKEFFYDERK